MAQNSSRNRFQREHFVDALHPDRFLGRHHREALAVTVAAVSVAGSVESSAACYYGCRHGILPSFGMVPGSIRSFFFSSLETVFLPQRSRITRGLFA